MSKYVFVVGGVMSSVGKGVTAASISAILQSRGYTATNIKCDMYINIDAGTIRPTQHGEVFVGTDGIESDQDLGNYERFTGNMMSSVNYITTGQVYQEVIRRERNLEYDGRDVEVVPDIPNEIIRRIEMATKKSEADVVVVEFGGTVGEYQLLLFLEAARMMKLRSPKDVAFVLVSYLPVPAHIGEMKTKPTQHAAHSLNSAGIQADFIIARGQQALDKPRRERLAIHCNIDGDDAISAPDVETIYEVPLVFEKAGFGDKLLKRMGLESKKENGLEKWETMVQRIKNVEEPVKIAVVGKYFGTGKFTLADSYISVIEAVKHASWSLNRKPVLEWVDSEVFEKDPTKISELSEYDGIIVPGGFGSRGIEGVIMAIKYARENNVPYFGLCYGMQLACIEVARNVAGLDGANTTEIDKNTPYPVIYLNPLQAENVKEKRYGGTMRLGSYDCELSNDSISRKAYGLSNISERHRHRYEFNNDYQDLLKKNGLQLVGVNPESGLVEIIELRKHLFFVGVQFHPEFQSTPMDPHPLFKAFIKAATEGKNRRN